MRRALPWIVTLAILVFLLTRPELRPEGVLAAVRSLEPRRFLPLFGAAVGVKLLGIAANAWRWGRLLRAQGIVLPYRWLLRSYFIGRWFGVVTPGTLGLDGFRLVDSARHTGQPVETAAVVVVDKVVGTVSLAVVLALFFPFGWRLLPIADPRRAALVFFAIVTAAVLAILLLLLPTLWTWVLGPVLPRLGRARARIDQVLAALTAWSHDRAALVQAVGAAVFGHITTALMYDLILEGMARGPAHDRPLVLFSAVVMTLATLIAPTVGGEGVRELVFVRLLAGIVDPAQAFLFGHIGFWIEKAVLSLPGGVLLLRDRRLSKPDGAPSAGA